MGKIFSGGVKFVVFALGTTSAMKMMMIVIIEGDN